MKSSLLGRTYMIAAIQIDEDGMTQPQSPHELRIDWELVDSILNNQLQPYMRWTSRNEQESANGRGTKSFACQTTSGQMYSIDESMVLEDITTKSPFPTPELNQPRIIMPADMKLSFNILPARRVVSTNQEYDHTWSSKPVGREGEICYLKSQS